MKKIIFGLILISFNFSLYAEAKDAKVLALLPFKIAGGGNGEAIAVALQGALLAELQKTGVYRLVSKTELDKVVQELHFSSSDLVEAKNSVEVGKLLSAEFLLSVSIAHDSGTYLIHAAMIQVKTGKIIHALNPFKLNKIEEVAKTGNLIASKLLNPSRDAESEINYYGTWIVTKTSSDVLSKSVTYKKLILNEDDTYELHLINNADNFVIFKGNFNLDGHKINLYHHELLINGQPNVNPSGQKLEGTLYIVNGQLYFALVSMQLKGPKRPDAMEIEYRNVAKRK